MFYFWRSGEEGELWLSGEGLRDAFSRMHPEGPECSEVILLADRDTLNASFVREPGLSAAAMTTAEDNFREFALELGFSNIQAGWTRQGGFGESLAASGLARNPLAWGVAAWVLVAVLRMGFSGTLLSTAWGVAAFAAAALFTTERGGEIRRWFRQRLGKRPGGGTGAS
ncbi:MAG: hypothetical protein WBJ42_07515 [Thermovirgaceae bacterium]|nr:hypothetical protein [Synergistales bacterium]HPC75247.1 hypothetical protein [Synergistales bacterium]HRU90489.1 hypothetical protein [Thermovirgaceae bacterium]